MIYPLTLFFFFYFVYFFRNFKTPSSRYLAGLTLCMLLAFLTLLLLLTNLIEYFDVMRNIFGINRYLGNWLIIRNYNVNWLIRFINVGVGGFLLCLYLFSLYLSHGMGKYIFSVADGIILSLLFIQFVIYDPFFLILFDKSGFYMPTFRNFLNRQGTFFFKIFNLALIYQSFKRMNQYRKHFPRSFSLRKITTRNIIGLLPPCLFFISLFNWFPRSLNKSTLLPGYYMIDFDQIILTPDFLTVFSLFLILSNGVGLFLILRTRSVESYYHNREIQMHSIAELGVRVFSHSMKNDLLAINGEVEFLQEKLSENKNRELIKSLELIEYHSRHAFGQINDLSHKVKYISLNMERISLDIPLKRAINHISFKRIDLEFDKNKKGPDVFLDPQYMEDVYYNLLQNSIKALDKTHMPHIHIQLTQENNWGMVTLSDNGKGIHKDYLKSIFTPFYSTGNKTINWGVGLSFCKRVVQAHEGEILVESTPGRGSTFTVMLPLL